MKNVATADGSNPSDDPTDPGKDDVDVPVEDKNGHLTIDKTSTSTPANGTAYEVGEVITYSIKATNDGNLTITNIEVKDDLTGDSWKIASLAPGKSETFTATYTVTEADRANGSVVNTATATGTSPDPENPDPTVDPGKDEEPIRQNFFTINYVFDWPGDAAPANAPAVPAAVTVTEHEAFTVSTAGYADIPYALAENGNAITVLRFNGWDTSTVVTSVNDVTADATVHGAWTIEMVWYTVTYTDGVPGEVLFADQVTTTLRIGAATPAFAGTPAREGYTFQGWAPAVTATVMGNTTYTAQWAPIVVPPVEPPEEEPPVEDNGRGGGDGLGEEILDDETPLANFTAWALLNLIAAIGSVCTALGMIITFFKKKNEDENVVKSAEGAAEQKGKKSKFFGLIPAVASVVIFLLTEDMSAQMVLTDKWTIVMACMLAATGITAYFTRNKKAEPEKADEASV